VTHKKEGNKKNYDDFGCSVCCLPVRSSSKIKIPYKIGGPELLYVKHRIFTLVSSFSNFNSRRRRRGKRRSDRYWLVWRDGL